MKEKKECLTVQLQLLRRDKHGTPRKQAHFYRHSTLPSIHLKKKKKQTNVTITHTNWKNFARNFPVTFSNDSYQWYSISVTNNYTVKAEQRQSTSEVSGKVFPEVQAQGARTSWGILFDFHYRNNFILCIDTRLWPPSYYKGIMF